MQFSKKEVDIYFLLRIRDIMIIKFMKLMFFVISTLFRTTFDVEYLGHFFTWYPL